MAIKNQIKTAILLAVLTALLLFVGSLFGRYGFIFALIFVVLMNVGSYWFSDKLVLMMYRAKQATEIQHPRLFKIVREVSSMAKIPMPRIWIIPSAQSNAFATGRNQKHASVACTEGILSLMNDNELKGVIAHEVSHIKNRDILISTIAGTIAGVISYIAAMARWATIFGGRERDNNNIISLMLLAILTPIIAVIIQLAISRSREYLADESAARLLRESDGLASALKKLDNDSKRHPMRLGNTSTAHLFISNPFRGQALMTLLSTHPSTKSRVERLMAMRF